MSARQIWTAIYEASGYRLSTLSEISSIDEGSLRKYLYGTRLPRSKNNKAMESLMVIAGNLPRIQFHPSYGYATPEQIEQLKIMKVGPDMDHLLKQIAEQTRNRGKFK